MNTRKKCKLLGAIFLIVFLLDYIGVFKHILEISYINFNYPYDGNIQPLVLDLRQNKKSDVHVINEYNYPYIKISNKCMEAESLRIVFLVKSAMGNFNQRTAIRNSWGFEKRFFDVPMKVVFVLGVNPGDSQIQHKVNTESAEFQDIIQADFIDSYYNNTIKTMMAFKWAVDYCSNSKFYMFVDDDYYVSVKNVLRFIRNPTQYPQYLKDTTNLKNPRKGAKRDSRNLHFNQKEIISDIKSANVHLQIIRNNVEASRFKRQILDFDLPDDIRLFAGFVFLSSPHRHKFSKWYVSLEEYPYDLWPPYVTAGSYILSKEALMDMYYGSMYTKHFRFDDIYLGLIAKKLDIEPFHCDEFHFYKKKYLKNNYEFVISSHGYSDPNELVKVWGEQKAMGNA
ncbi:beta-1,3-galactosyltransferase brn [Trichogramma pretiosum]|uniref:beta-1,3-galactosyltransferase brn n=1 Tax=Trichogramma pretiosum TaxID=7493 RepID=UPI0006C9CA67|nr:beta-1,3-galactosyltransferase brn [Trichogramma pretiosum]